MHRGTAYGESLCPPTSAPASPLFWQGVSRAQIFRIMLYHVEEITMPGPVGAWVENQQSDTHDMQAPECLGQWLFIPHHP